ncbi:MAG: SDR family oxidoreductase [Desulfobulbaceae bacterium]|nr:SDR family oxidoreductase [Desulfobulbaceae bacterium]
MQLQGKTVLIPGASRPVGRAIARAFGQAGASLVLPVYDWPDSITEMNQDFLEAGFSFHTLKADLRKKTDVLKVVDWINETSGHLDFLINNIERGGMPVVHGSYDLPHNSDQWDIEIDTTLKAKWLLFHHCLPLMQKCSPSTQGSVVNISSIAGETGRSGPAAHFFNDGYSAANRAIRTLTETWARQAAPAIRVNELSLGLIRNRHGEETRGWKALTADEKTAIGDQILLDRTGYPEEVAKCVFFLAVSATYMTGTVMKMDGGFSLGASRVPSMPPGIL